MALEPGNAGIARSQSLCAIKHESAAPRAMSSKRENQRFVLASAARRAVERQRQVEAQIAAIGAYLARKQPGGGGGALGGGGRQGA